MPSSGAPCAGMCPLLAVSDMVVWGDIPPPPVDEDALAELAVLMVMVVALAL